MTSFSWIWQVSVLVQLVFFGWQQTNFCPCLYWQIIFFYLKTFKKQLFTKQGSYFSMVEFLDKSKCVEWAANLVQVVDECSELGVFTPKTLVKVLWYRVTGFFLMLSVVKCRQITSTVINYHVGWTISRYVTWLRMFVSLFVHLYLFNYLFFYLFNYV